MQPKAMIKNFFKILPFLLTLSACGFLPANISGIAREGSHENKEYAAVYIPKGDVYLQNGSYACTAHIDNNSHQAVCYVSPLHKDTVGVHVFDYAEDLKGKSLNVTITYHFRRPRIFYSADEIQEEIHKDSVAELQARLLDPTYTFR